MKIVFFGTPDYVIPILEGLHKAFKTHEDSPIVAVVTQSPKPSGRDKKITYSPVDSWAHEHKIPIYFDNRKLLEDRVVADVAVLASYGEIIPSEVINYFPHGILVIHPSILPQFRWSSPVPAAMITNTNPTGVSIFKMDEKFDHGPVVGQFYEEIRPDDTNQTLRDRLFANSVDPLVKMLPAYISAKIKPKAQDDSKASYASMVKREDGFIPPEIIYAALYGKINETEWSISFIKIENSTYKLVPTANNIEIFIRAMHPWPGAWTQLHVDSSGQAKRLKIMKAHTKNDKLILDEVQLEGKNAVAWEQLMAGYPNIRF